MNATVILACRSEKRCQSAADSLEGLTLQTSRISLDANLDASSTLVTGDVKVDVGLDISSLSSVRAFSDSILKRPENTSLMTEL